MSTLVRVCMGRLTTLLHHVVRGHPVAVHARDEVFSWFQLFVRGLTKREDFGFTAVVEAVVEVVRGVGGFMERDIVDSHFR